jgi:uncharacterized protein YbjT (DUF2867 family)
VRLFLLGATGNSGRRILRFALDRGYQVTAFVRDRKKLAEILGRSLPQGLKDAASVNLNNLDRNGRFSRRRVGVALPVGQGNFKADLPS